MQNNTNGTRRIDLSNCKLLSTYGNNPTDLAKGTPDKIGAVSTKVGFTKVGFTKVGFTKVGAFRKR